MCCSNPAVTSPTLPPVSVYTVVYMRIESVEWVRVQDLKGFGCPLPTAASGKAFYKFRLFTIYKNNMSCFRPCTKSKFFKIAFWTNQYFSHTTGCLCHLSPAFENMESLSKDRKCKLDAHTKKSIYLYIIIFSGLLYSGWPLQLDWNIPLL